MGRADGARFCRARLREYAQYGCPVVNESSADLPLNHARRAECRGVVHVQGVIAPADQPDEAFALEVVRELGQDWQLGPSGGIDTHCGSR
jgi:hypothetical protein